MLTHSFARADDLYLEVFVNGAPRNIITRFTHHADGMLSADAKDLRDSGVLPAGKRDGEVRLDEIPLLGWRLVEAEQAIRLIVPEQGLAPHELAAGQSSASDDLDATPDKARIDHGTGLVLNYALSTSRWSGTDGISGTEMSGQFDARVFTPSGTLSHGFALVPRQSDHEVQRLDTYWRSSFPSRLFQLQLGDIATRGPGWTRPVRLGGMMIERNFALRPDVVTIPLAGYEGRADLPSTVEVYAGSVLAYTAEVPAGPFSIRDLPLAAGSGVARLVLRDVTGKETQADLPFLITDQLLRSGASDFAVSAGRPRLGAGTQSDRYADEVFATGTLRYGLTDSITLSGHAEGGLNLAMGGIGTTFRIGTLGTASISLAHSETETSDGTLIDISSEFQIGQLRASGRLVQTQGSFADIAAQTADPAAGASSGSEFPKGIAQLSLSHPIPDLPGSGANLFLSDIQRTAGNAEQTFGISYSQMIGRQSSLTLSAAAIRGEREDSVAGISLHVPLGPRSSVGSSSERTNSGWRHQLHAEGRSETSIPGWNWRLQADQATGRSIRGSAMASGRLGQAEVAGRVDPENAALGLRIDGAIVAAGGGVFASRRIDDAFAVVDVGAPDVLVSAENRPVGKTGGSGKILVPDLRPWEENKISIDPLGLPLDATMGATDQIVRPAHRSGTVVDFGVQTESDSALLVLLDGAGKPLEVGGRAVLLGQGEEFLVGFDGEIFLTGLSASNTLEVTYPDGSQCRADITFNPSDNFLGNLREAPCL